MSGNIENASNHEIHINDGKRYFYITGSQINTLNPTNFSAFQTHKKNTAFFGTHINVPANAGHIVLSSPKSNIQSENIIYHFGYNRSELDQHQNTSSLMAYEMKQTQINFFVCPPHPNPSSQNFPQFSKTIIKGLGDTCNPLELGKNPFSSKTHIVQVNGGYNLLTYKPRTTDCQVILSQHSNTDIEIATHYPIISIAYDVFKTKKGHSYLKMQTLWKNNQSYMGQNIPKTIHNLYIFYGDQLTTKDVSLNFNIQKVNGKGLQLTNKVSLKDYIHKAENSQGMISIRSR